MNTQRLAVEYVLWGCVGLLALVLALIWLIALNRNKMKNLKTQMGVSMDVLRNLSPDKGLEENLDRMLEVISDFIAAPTYTFYVLDKKGQTYLLKAVRYLSKEFGEVRPSYSGLASFQQSSYTPPLSIPMNKRVYEIKKVQEGEIPLYYIPVGEKGLMIVGPLDLIKKGSVDNLKVVSEQMNYLLQSLITAEEIRTQSQIVMASGKALQKISNISMDWKTMVEVMIKLCIQSIQAAGGIMITRSGADIDFPVHIGADKELLEHLGEDPDTLHKLYEKVRDQEYVYIRRSDELYYQLPPYFAAAGMETLTLIRLETWQDNLLLLWFEDDGNRAHQEVNMILNTMIEHVRSVIGHQTGLKQFTAVYLDILKMLVKLIDNLNPYTVGYSELMSRYSVAIARQLGLGEEEIKDIALAAYLSNIGVLGLSSSLFEKEGKYTDEEFELMKLHCEVGASIVNVATGNERVASYILHHHERVDGNGYPFGLKDEEIPVGSKILAVVQTFLAKIGGRKYREPLGFNQAIALIESAAGSQLDERIVQVFVDWFKNKRIAAAGSGRPMGACYEMLCVPSAICQSCPAYRRKDIPCWEVENNLCKAHGKDCNSCIVRTEFMTRNEWREAES